jgi:hypothetical protein
MKLGEFKYETRMPPSVEKDVELSKLKLRYSRRAVRRFAVLSLVMLAIPVAAFQLEIDRALKWFALGFSVLFLAMSFLFTGVLSPADDEKLDPANYYGRGTLIGLGIFWGLIVCGLIWMIWVSYPRD